MEDLWTVRQAALRTGLSEHTLRYYERIGLVAPVRRGPTSGHRRYTAEDLRWLMTLACLRSTGMPLEAMRQFADLNGQGDRTLGERAALLERHRQTVRRRIARLERQDDYLQLKAAYLCELDAHGGRVTDAAARLRARMEALHTQDTGEHDEDTDLG